MQQNLTEGPISKHIMRIALPVITGLFFNTMFNVVDTYFAGQLGTESLAGMSASFSVFFILTAFTSGLATGLGALLSHALGRQDHDKVNRLTVNGLILTLSVCAILTAAGVFFAPQLLLLLGAEGEAYREGARYVSTIYAGALFFGFNAMLNAFLSARGLTKPYRNFLIVGFVFNLILDPLLIYGWLGLPRLGTMGVALATVIIQLIGNIYLTVQVRRLIGLQLTDLPVRRFSLPLQREILAQGIPAILNMMTIAIGIFVINFFIYRFGNDASTAGYGAAVRVEQIALLPAIGLNTATLTMAGQNAGAGKPARVRESFFTAMKIGLLIMTAGMILVYPLAPILIGLFNDNPQVIFEGARYLRIEFLAFNGYVIINISLSLLQGLKKPHYAVWIGLYRQLAMPALLFYLLGDVLDLGLDGIWWGIVTTVWTGALAMLFFACREIQVKVKGKG